MDLGKSIREAQIKSYEHEKKSAFVWHVKKNWCENLNFLNFQLNNC